MKNSDITNNFNKGKGKMKNGKRTNKKAKKNTKNVYNSKCIRLREQLMNKKSK